MNRIHKLCYILFERFPSSTLQYITNTKAPFCPLVNLPFSFLMQIGQMSQHIPIKCGMNRSAGKSAAICSCLCVNHQLPLNIHLDSYSSARV